MDLFLKYKLRQLGRKAEPEKTFVADLYRKIEAEFEPKQAIIPVWKLAAVPALALIMTLFGTGVYAYASDDVLPGNPLYPVKQGLEKVEEKLAIRKQAKLYVAVKHLERRLKEDKALFIRQKTVPETRLKEFKNKYQEIEGQVKKIPEGQRSALERVLSNVSLDTIILEADIYKIDTEKKRQKVLEKSLDEKKSQKENN